MLKMGRMKKTDQLKEVEESDSAVSKKCEVLADLLRKSKCTLVYTGAGISTAASIPDYRGPNGVWTLAEKGLTPLQCADPVESAPTKSHMVLKEMCRHGIIRHILSQNCDGLHLRSGIPQKMLSEIHGNMHIEVCHKCNPPRQFVRSFDVTQKSQFRKHMTGRNCITCNSSLVDTIVHFGEVGRAPWPLNWKGVISLIDECDLILCVGTSLTVLKQYRFLWPKSSNVQIAIVNLQWTPKDRISCLKINAKCDIVLDKLAKLLGLSISGYCRDCDPVLNPRRNTRVNELMGMLTDCQCHIRLRRPSLKEDGPQGTPGWWAAGIQKTIRRSSQGKTKRHAERSRKRSYQSSQNRRKKLNRSRKKCDSPPCKTPRSNEYGKLKMDGALSDDDLNPSQSTIIDGKEISNQISGASSQYLVSLSVSEGIRIASTSVYGGHCDVRTSEDADISFKYSKSRNESSDEEIDWHPSCSITNNQKSKSQCERNEFNIISLASVHSSKTLTEKYADLTKITKDCDNEKSFSIPSHPSFLADDSATLFQEDIYNVLSSLLSSICRNC